MKRLQSANLDAILFEWFRQNIWIAGQILCQTGKELHKELNIEVPCVDEMVVPVC